MHTFHTLKINWPIYTSAFWSTFGKLAQDHHTVPGIHMNKPLSTEFKGTQCRQVTQFNSQEAQPLIFLGHLTYLAFSHFRA